MLIRQKLAKFNFKENSISLSLCSLCNTLCSLCSKIQHKEHKRKAINKFKQIIIAVTMY